jgi:signal transduction histidine kinase
MPRWLPKGHGGLSDSPIARWGELVGLIVAVWVAVMTVVRGASFPQLVAAVVVPAPWLVWFVPDAARLRPALLVGSSVAAWVLIGHDSASSAMPMLIALPAFAAFTEPLAVGVGVSVLCAAWPLHWAWIDRHTTQGWYLSAFGVAAGWAGGRLANRQESLITQLREAQAELAASAVAEERRRIAREVHDVIAHTLTVTLLHLSGARLVLGRRDHEVDDALLAAEKAARESLADLRRTVGLLGDGPADTTPLPGFDELPDLVRSYQTAGMIVDLDCDPVGNGSVPAATGLVAYRVIQESLTNSAKHAATGAVTVTVRAGSDALDITVHTTAAPTPRGGDGSGRGLRGMRERVESLGGEFRAGRTADGWCVQARLPLQEGGE